MDKCHFSLSLNKARSYCSSTVPRLHVYHSRVSRPVGPNDQLILRSSVINRTSSVSVAHSSSSSTSLVGRSAVATEPRSASPRFIRSPTQTILGCVQRGRNTNNELNVKRPHDDNTNPNCSTPSNCDTILKNVTCALT